MFQNRAKPSRFAVNTDEALAIAAISPDRVTYIPGCGYKRFARNMQGATLITEGQRRYLWQMVIRFRSQIADQGLVEMARRMGITLHRTSISGEPVFQRSDVFQSIRQAERAEQSAEHRSLFSL
jgi:hypothetical protein